MLDDPLRVPRGRTAARLVAAAAIMALVAGACGGDEPVARSEVAISAETSAPPISVGASQPTVDVDSGDPRTAPEEPTGSAGEPSDPAPLPDAVAAYARSGAVCAAAYQAGSAYAAGRGKGLDARESAYVDAYEAAIESSDYRDYAPAAEAALAAYEAAMSADDAYFAAARHSAVAYAACAAGVANALEASGAVGTDALAVTFEAVLAAVRAESAISAYYAYGASCDGLDGSGRGADWRPCRDLPHEEAAAGVVAACDTLPHRIDGYAYRLGRSALRAVLDARDSYVDSDRLAEAVDGALADIYDAVRTSYDDAYTADAESRAASLEAARATALADIAAADAEGIVWHEDMGMDARDDATFEAIRTAVADAFPGRDHDIADAYSGAIRFAASRAGSAYTTASESGVLVAMEVYPSSGLLAERTLDALSALVAAHDAAGAADDLRRTLGAALAVAGIPAKDYAVCHAAIAFAGALAGDGVADVSAALGDAASAAAAAAVAAMTVG